MSPVVENDSWIEARFSAGSPSYGLLPCFIDIWMLPFSSLEVNSFGRTANRLMTSFVAVSASIVLPFPLRSHKLQPMYIIEIVVCDHPSGLPVLPESVVQQRLASVQALHPFHPVLLHLRVLCSMLQLHTACHRKAHGLLLLTAVPIVGSSFPVYEIVIRN